MPNQRKGQSEGALSRSVLAGSGEELGFADGRPRPWLDTTLAQVGLQLSGGMQAVERLVSLPRTPRLAIQSKIILDATRAPKKRGKRSAYGVKRKIRYGCSRKPRMSFSPTSTAIGISPVKASYPATVSRALPLSAFIPGRRQTKNREEYLVASPLLGDFGIRATSSCLSRRLPLSHQPGHSAGRREPGIRAPARQSNARPAATCTRFRWRRR